MRRPDFSEYVAHFTKDSAPIASKEHGNDVSLKGIKGNASDKLISILQSKTLEKGKSQLTTAMKGSGACLTISRFSCHK